MPLPEWVMIVDLDLDPACEEEWNRWYDEIHLPEILDCPGFVRGTRFIAPEDDSTGRRRHITIYELEGPQAFHSEEFAERRGLGEFSDRATARTRLYRRHLSVGGQADDD